MNIWLFALLYLPTTVLDKTVNISTIINNNLRYFFVLFMCWIIKGKMRNY